MTLTDLIARAWEQERPRLHRPEVTVWGNWMRVRRALQ